MAQKYKVYLNNHLIILLFSKDFYEHSNEYHYVQHEPSINEMEENVNRLFHVEVGETLCFYSDHLDELWNNFNSIFNVIHAGGGLVKNQRGGFLFIFRNGKWDLPKGKLDPGETIEQCAVREVEEECGIQQLSLGNKIKNTYHIYQFNGKNVLKYTHWYHMRYQGDELLVPQLEEGITRAEWILPDNFLTVKKNTYENIKEVLIHVVI